MVMRYVLRWRKVKIMSGKKGSFEHCCLIGASESEDGLLPEWGVLGLSLAMCVIPYYHIHTVHVLRGRSKLHIYVGRIDNWSDATF